MKRVVMWVNTINHSSSHEFPKSYLIIETETIPVTQNRDI